MLGTGVLPHACVAVTNRRPSQIQSNQRPKLRPPSLLRRDKGDVAASRIPREKSATRCEHILVRHQRCRTTPADLPRRKVHQAACCALGAVQGRLLPPGYRSCPLQPSWGRML